SILIFTSRRPGRRMAGSMRSGRFEAPMTTTLRRPSTPSTSVRNCGTIVCSTSEEIDRKSTRLNSSHLGISYAVFCLKKKRMLPRTLGRVDGFAQDEGARKRDEGGDVLRGLLAASGEAFEALDLADTLLDAGAHYVAG